MSGTSRTPDRIGGQNESVPTTFPPSQATSPDEAPPPRPTHAYYEPPSPYYPSPPPYISTGYHFYYPLQPYPVPYSPGFYPTVNQYYYHPGSHFPPPAAVGATTSPSFVHQPTSDVFDEVDGFAGVESPHDEQQQQQTNADAADESYPDSPSEQGEQDAPAPKDPRTTVAKVWRRKDDARLRTYVGKLGVSRIDEVAARRFPDRTVEDVRARWETLNRPARSWTHEEDKKLRILVLENAFVDHNDEPDADWMLVSKKIGNNRLPTQCHDRWMELLARLRDDQEKGDHVPIDLPTLRISKSLRTVPAKTSVSKRASSMRSPASLWMASRCKVPDSQMAKMKAIVLGANKQKDEE